MSRYTITTEDVQFAQEFMRDPGGYRSPGLQRVLNVMRTDTTQGKYVLIVKEPHTRWVLGRSPCRRGEPIEILGEYEFDNLEDAERTVFRLRWRALTDTDLPL